MYFTGKLGSKEDEDDGEGLEDKAHKAGEPVVEGDSVEEPKGDGGLGAPLGVAVEDLAVPLGAALARSFAEGLEAGGDDNSAPGVTDSDGRDYEGVREPAVTLGASLARSPSEGLEEAGKSQELPTVMPGDPRMNALELENP